MLSYCWTTKGSKIAHSVDAVLGTIIGGTSRWFLQGFGAGMGVLLAAKLLGVV